MWQGERPKLDLAFGIQKHTTTEVYAGYEQLSRFCGGDASRVWRAGEDAIEQSARVPFGCGVHKHYHERIRLDSEPHLHS